MDAATHALASLALARGFFPRRGWALPVGMILAGTVADLDSVSALFGPRAYFAAHYTWTHSILAAWIVAALATFLVLRLRDKNSQPLNLVLLGVATSAFFHLMLDLFGTDGEMLLWPFRRTRFAADYLPYFDPWIMFLLGAAIVVPEIFRLVSSEIGAKDKTPRGRNAAIFALAFLVLYVGARGILRSSTLALLDSRSYRTESPRRVGSFPDTISLATWHGVVETQSMLCVVDVPAFGATQFNAESADCRHKPDFSTELDAAQRTPAAQAILHIAQFPRASVDKSADGAEIAIRSLRDELPGNSTHALAARVLLDPKGKVLSQELVWAKELRLR